MNIELRSAVSAVLAASLTLVARADDAPKAAAAQPAAAAPAANIDPKAKSIHDRGVDAVRKLEGVDLTSSLAVEGIDPSMLPPGIGEPAQVSVDFGKAGASGDQATRFAMDCTQGGKPAGRIVFDGKSTLATDEASKSFMQVPGDGQMLLGPRGALMPNWFFEKRAQADMPEGDGMPRLVEMTVTGEETVDGVTCDVVRSVRVFVPDSMGEDEGAPQGELRLTETIAFARQDGLPRRISQSQSAGGPSGGPMTLTTSFTGLKANPGHADAKFATTAPAGYKKMDMPSGDGPSEAPALSVKAGDAAPDFSLTDLAGKTVSLASLKGQVVLLDFWATWCGPCKAAMPAIQRIHDDYKGKGVTVLGINTWENKADAAKQYVEKKGFSYPCLLKGDDLAKAYGMTGIPTLVVIGKDGKIAEIEVGMAPGGDAGLRKAIDAALAAK